MDNYNDIGSFKQLEAALTEFINKKDTLERSQIDSQVNQLWSKFRSLLEALDIRSQQIMHNDVLITHRIENDSDAIMDECFRRVDCLELFLKMDPEPELKNTLEGLLPSFKEYADLFKNQVATQRQMLQILNNPNNRKKTQNNSGCMVLVAVVLVCAACLIVL